MLKRSNVERQAHPPQGRDFRDHAGRQRGKSPNPEPRFPNKSSLNPPIVTIFGAGIAGLTAAHELVERGFLVQVVEATEDPYASGRPLVGGMAANQGARVRANIEDLHSEMVVALAQGRLPAERRVEGLSRDEQPPPDPREVKVAQFLLTLFAANRTLWVQSEKPQRIHQTIWSRPTDKDNAHAGTESFKDVILEDLRRAKAAYRQRWLWDLAVRLSLLGDISSRKGNNDSNSVTKDGEEELKLAKKLLEQFGRQPSNIALVSDILRALHSKPDDVSDLEPSDITKYGDSLVGPAMEREFLSFELVAYYRAGREDARDQAKQLMQDWSNVFATESNGEFLHNCLVKPEQAAHQPLREAASPPFLPDTVLAWLELRAVELRLPGEHGYRFFPSFYRHINDTMRRIPLFMGDQPTTRTVLDNLLPTVRQGLGFDLSKDKVFERGDSCQDELRKLKNEPPLARKQVWPPKTEKGALVVEFHRDRATSIEGLRERTDRFIHKLGGTMADAALFFAKLLRYMTSSPERREAYEEQSWEDFIGIDDFSPQMAAQIQAAAQVLLAFSTGVADARTYGDTVLQLFMDQFQEGVGVDRTLNGPTSDAWLEPWRDYLERQGVRFFWGSLKELREETLPYGNTTRKELVPIVTEPGDNEKEGETLWSQAGHRLLTWQSPNPGDRPDFYVMALDLPSAAKLTAGFAKNSRCPEFARLEKFKTEVDLSGALKDMTGVQLFFDAKTSIGRGHMYFPLAPWGLSSISQSEFWSRRCGFADGFMGVLSVDVADTEKTPPNSGESFRRTLEKGAADASDAPYGMSDSDSETYARWLAGRGVWQELSTRIDPKQDRLSHPRCFHVDANLHFATDEDGKRTWRNSTPYLAAQEKNWKHRPGLMRSPLATRAKFDTSEEDYTSSVDEIDYRMNYERWVLCGTYNATYTRMTTMEAANESARHAVRTILDALNVDDSSVDSVSKGQDEDGIALEINLGTNKTYNGASKRRVFDNPDIWNPESAEPADLAMLRRVDRRLMYALFEEGEPNPPPHFMDICDFDRKLKLAIEAAKIYGNATQANELLSLSLAGLRESASQTLQDTGKDASDLDPHIAKAASILAKAFEKSPFVDQLEEARKVIQNFMKK